MEADEQTPQDAEPSARRPTRRRGLDGRTLAICVTVALVAGLVAALVASALIGSDTTDAADGPSPTIQLTDQIDTEDLLGVELLTLDGKATTLGDRLGDQPVVVNLWAQSCAPCIKEMPLLEQAHQDNPDVAFLGVDTQDQLDKAKVMADRTGITYPWVQDPKGDFFFAAQSAGMPTTFIITGSGEIVASKTGSFDSQRELQGWLDAHVA